MMDPPISYKLLPPPEGRRGDNGQIVAASAPLAPIGRAPVCLVVNARPPLPCVATEWRPCGRGSLHGRWWALVLAIFCLLGVPVVRKPLLYTPWSRFTTYKSSDGDSGSVSDCTFTCAVHASEQPLKQPDDHANELHAPMRETADIFSRLPHVRLPEGLRESLQSVDWDALISMGAAGLDVAVSEGRQFVKEVMHSGRVQHLLRTLQVEKVEEGLESLAENLGLKEKLPAQVLRERRILEVSFVPIFVFARERMLERSRDNEEAALKIALGDHQLKVVLKHFENVPPARSMSVAPSTLDGIYENLVKVTTVLMNSRPVAVSLVMRIELITREFVEYCRTVLSAVTRYISLVNRFHKNRRALFFFAQHTLPRVIKILLLLNRLQEVLLDRARSEFAERPQQCGALHREARRLSAHTADLISFLGSIAHACIAATSPQFQVDFARALSAYDRGEDPATAFKVFVEVPRDLLQQAASPSEQPQKEHGTASHKLLRGTPPQTTKEHGSVRVKTTTASPDSQRNAGSEEIEQSSGHASGKEEKHQDFSRLEATEYKTMMREHLNELQDLPRTYTDDTTATSPMREAVATAVRDILHGDGDGFPETRLQPSRVATDAGTLAVGMPLEAFVASSPRLFIDAPRAPARTEPPSAASSYSTFPVDPAGDGNADASRSATAGECGSDDVAQTRGPDIVHGAAITESGED